MEVERERRDDLPHVHQHQQQELVVGHVLARPRGGAGRCSRCRRRRVLAAAGDEHGDQQRRAARATRGRSPRASTPHSANSSTNSSRLRATALETESRMERDDARRASRSSPSAGDRGQSAYRSDSTSFHSAISSSAPGVRSRSLRAISVFSRLRRLRQLALELGQLVFAGASATQLALSFAGTHAGLLGRGIVVAALASADAKLCSNSAAAERQCGELSSARAAALAQASRRCGGLDQRRRSAGGNRTSTRLPGVSSTPLGSAMRTGSPRSATSVSEPL